MPPHVIPPSFSFRSTYDTRFRSWLLNPSNQRRRRFGCLAPLPGEHHPCIFNLSCISSLCSPSLGREEVIARTMGYFWVLFEGKKLIRIWLEVCGEREMYSEIGGLKALPRWFSGDRALEIKKRGGLLFWRFDHRSICPARDDFVHCFTDGKYVLNRIDDPSLSWKAFYLFIYFPSSFYFLGMASLRQGEKSQEC